MITVSVCMITYNHELFIAEAINSILMQETNFDYEVIIANDQSTDNTDLQIKKYITDHVKGNKIKYTNNKKNLGMQANLFFALQQCKGKYIAYCEGDDYWTDRFKLQKQVDYIAEHEDCNLVFTDVKCLDQQENKLYENWATCIKNKYEFKHLVQRNVITTCTVLFRNPDNMEAIKNWLSPFEIGDYPLYLFLLRTGYGYFLNETTAVYRQHTTGIFSLKGPANLIETNIDLLRSLEKSPLTNRELFYTRKSLVKWYYAKAVRMSNNLQFRSIRPFLRKEFSWLYVYYNYTYFFRLVVIFFFPKLKAGVFKSE